MQVAMAAAAATMPTAVRAIIVPGNGCDNVRAANWYAWLEGKLNDLPEFDEVILRDMPDPIAARRYKWLPFLVDVCKADARTVVIGHSSGAVAAMRLLETTKLHGALLVSACHSDLGDAGERASGYYPPSGGPWRWSAMRDNCGGNLRVLHSDNDPFIPLDEARHVADSIGCPLQVEPGRSHFFKPCDAIVDAAVALARGGAGQAEGE